MPNLGNMEIYPTHYDYNGPFARYIQIATVDGEVFIWDLSRFVTPPPGLNRLLTVPDPMIRLVAHNHTNDALAYYRMYGMRTVPYLEYKKPASATRFQANFTDTEHLFCVHGERFPDGFVPPSNRLTDLLRFVFDLQPEDDPSDGMGFGQFWNRRLTPNMERYLAMDAIGCLDLYLEYLRIGVVEPEETILILEDENAAQAYGLDELSEKMRKAQKSGRPHLSRLSRSPDSLAIQQRRLIRNKRRKANNARERRSSHGGVGNIFSRLGADDDDYIESEEEGVDPNLATETALLKAFGPPTRIPVAGHVRLFSPDRPVQVSSEEVGTIADFSTFMGRDQSTFMERDNVTFQSTERTQTVTEHPENVSQDEPSEVTEFVDVDPLPLPDEEMEVENPLSEKEKDSTASQSIPPPKKHITPMMESDRELIIQRMNEEHVHRALMEIRRREQLHGPIPSVDQPSTVAQANLRDAPSIMAAVTLVLESRFDSIESALTSERIMGLHNLTNEQLDVFLDCLHQSDNLALNLGTNFLTEICPNSTIPQMNLPNTDKFILLAKPKPIIRNIVLRPKHRENKCVRYLLNKPDETIVEDLQDVSTYFATSGRVLFEVPASSVEIIQNRFQPPRQYFEADRDKVKPQFISIPTFEGQVVDLPIELTIGQIDNVFRMLQAFHEYHRVVIRRHNPMPISPNADFFQTSLGGFFWQCYNLESSAVVAYRMTELARRLLIALVSGAAFHPRWRELCISHNITGIPTDVGETHDFLVSLNKGLASGRRTNKEIRAAKRNRKLERKAEQAHALGELPGTTPKKPKVEKATGTPKKPKVDRPTTTPKKPKVEKITPKSNKKDDKTPNTTQVPDAYRIPKVKKETPKSGPTPLRDLPFDSANKSKFRVNLPKDKKQTSQKGKPMHGESSITYPERFKRESSFRGSDSSQGSIRGSSQSRNEPRQGGASRYRDFYGRTFVPSDQSGDDRKPPRGQQDQSETPRGASQRAPWPPATQVTDTGLHTQQGTAFIPRHRAHLTIPQQQLRSQEVQQIQSPAVPMSLVPAAQAAALQMTSTPITGTLLPPPLIDTRTVQAQNRDHELYMQQCNKAWFQANSLVVQPQPEQGTVGSQEPPVQDIPSGSRPAAPIDTFGLSTPMAAMVGYEVKIPRKKKTPKSAGDRSRRLKGTPKKKKPKKNGDGSGKK